MAFTQAELDAHEQAMADALNVKQTSVETMSTTFTSLDDQLRLRSLMKREIDAAPTHRLAYTTKGT